MDISQKILIRFGVMIYKYLETRRDLGTLYTMPLVFTLQCRYLLGVRDDGSPFEPAFDPHLAELSAYVAGIFLSGGYDSTTAHEALAPIPFGASTFGLDLYEAPLAEAIEQYFQRLTARPGAVHKTLDKEYTE